MIGTVKTTLSVLLLKNVEAKVCQIGIKKSFHYLITKNYREINLFYRFCQETTQKQHWRP